MDSCLARCLVQVSAPRVLPLSSSSRRVQFAACTQWSTARDAPIHYAPDRRKQSPFSTSTKCLQPKERKPEGQYEAQQAQTDTDSQPAANFSQNITQQERDHFSKIEEVSRKNQMRSPWLREGSDKPPVSRNVSAGAMTKGKLLTTPSRMLKLILPLSTRDTNKDRKNLEPLALLVHPQQPLSYLERLIQSELPVVKDDDGNEKIPRVIFRAQDRTDEDIGDPQQAKRKDKVGGGKGSAEEMWERDIDEQQELETADHTTMIDGKAVKTGKINRGASEPASGGPVKEDSKQQSTLGDDLHDDFVRWSPSTEIGDFIRDAARGKEFSVEIQGAPEPIYVGVPSFSDRTYYLRMRLRKTAKAISSLADVKRECDDIAHRGAKRVAQGGFAGLLSWWGVVYYLTFMTDLGWDVMEPVTYLVGLSGLIGGYMWFLYHNREVSYRSAMNFTVSRRQSQLYEQKGFEVHKWEFLVEEGNRLRREIKMVADEYDVEWDESKDEGSDEKVQEALRKDRRRKKDKDGEEDSKKKDDDDD